MRPTNPSENPSVKSIETGFRAVETLSVPAVAYHELADVPVQRVDLIEQIQANLQTMTDLQSRMNFMMREIRYLMKI